MSSISTPDEYSSLNEVQVHVASAGHPITVRLFDRGCSAGSMYLEMKHAVALASQLQVAIEQAKYRTLATA